MDFQSFLQQAREAVQRRYQQAYDDDIFVKQQRSYGVPDEIIRANLPSRRNQYQGNYPMNAVQQNQTRNILNTPERQAADQYFRSNPNATSYNGRSMDSYVPSREDVSSAWNQVGFAPPSMPQQDSRNFIPRRNYGQTQQYNPASTPVSMMPEGRMSAYNNFTQRYQPQQPTNTQIQTGGSNPNMPIQSSQQTQPSQQAYNPSSVKKAQSAYENATRLGGYAPAAQQYGVSLNDISTYRQSSPKVQKTSFGQGIRPQSNNAAFQDPNLQNNIRQNVQSAVASNPYLSSNRNINTTRRARLNTQRSLYQ